MKAKIIYSILFLFLSATVAKSQKNPDNRNEPLTANESLEFIGSDLQDIARRLKELNKSINKAYDKIANNMGFKISDDQRKIIVSFEILNKAEVRAANLQKTKIELLDKKAGIETRIRILRNSLSYENIERSVFSNWHK